MLAKTTNAAIKWRSGGLIRGLKSWRSLILEEEHSLTNSMSLGTSVLRT